MFTNVSEEALFPTFVWVHDLEPARAEALNARMFRDIDRMTAPRPQLQPGQNWQTEQTLHEHPQFAELVEIIEAAVRGVISRMALEHEAFELTALWANINPPGAPHPPHFHPNNFLSGVYYLQVTEGQDSITFHEPRTQVDIVAPHVQRFSQYTAPHYSMPVKPGRLVIFPAWLTHSVKRNESQRLRISISFNAMFADYVEKLSRPRWQGIPLRAISEDESA